MPPQVGCRNSLRNEMLTV